MLELQVQTVTLGLVSSDAASGFGQQWVTDAVAFAPMVTMLIVRSCKLANSLAIGHASLAYQGHHVSWFWHAVVRKPLYKCFIHMLREVNPQTAKLIETSPRIPNPNRKTKTVKLNEKFDKTYQRVQAYAVFHVLLVLQSCWT